MTGTRTTALLLALLVATTAPASAADGSGSGDGARSALTIELDADGGAEVTLRLAYDLTTDEEREAFGTLRTDAEARDRVTTAFRDRMRSVARSAADATGREMRLSGASTDFRLDDGNDTGVVSLSANWTAFAAVDAGRLRVGEPFASGFEADFPVRIVAPPGYDLTASTVTPADRDGRTATWDAGTAFDGFEATFGPVDAGSDTGGSNASASTVDGFGAPLTVVALAAAALIAGRRR